MSKKDKLKIAIFHNLPQGGAKRYLYEISRRLIKKYHIDEYKLSTSSQFLRLDKIVDNSKSYTYYGGKGLNTTYRTLFKLPRVHKKIANDINRSKYDLVITTHDYFTKSPYIHKFLVAPILYLCHEPQREFYEKTSIHAPRMREKIMNILRIPIKYIDRINARAANVIVANSKYSREYIHKVYGIKPLFIYPGVDINKFTSSNKKHNFVLAVGSLMPFKGHNFVIESLGRIKSKNRPSLIIVGSSNDYYKDKLVKIAKRNGVKCKILSNISDIQMKNLYSTSRAYVSGAYREPFGLATIEAIASGTPAIVVGEGGAGEQIINGVNGFITRRNKSEFADKISRVINNRKRFKIRSKKEIDKKWGWDKTAVEIEQIIKNILYKKSWRGLSN